MDNGIILFITGAAGAAAIKLLDGVVQFFLQRKAKKEDKADDQMSACASKITDILGIVGSISERLDSHIKADREGSADASRARILRFNNELLRNQGHTKEEFIEVLSDIDTYEKFCADNPDYPNSRAVHAIANIGRVYDERLVKHDFLQEVQDEEG